MIPIVGQLIDGPSGPNSIRLEEYLNSGAFGRVFRAIDLTSNAKLAVKFPQVYNLSPLNQAELVAFRADLTAAKLIEHPNVVRVLYTKDDSEGCFPYLVMEFIEGGSLADFLDNLHNSNQHLTADELCSWMGQIIDATEAINNVMIHRDIRPDNILVSADGLKIIDFGIAKIIGAATRTQTFKGSQAMRYMAPEGWKMESNEIQLDMYSVGITFFEMATLQYPYDPPSSSRIGEYEEMHLFGKSKSIQSLRQDLPPQIVQMIIRLMAKNPRDRFRNWGEVRNVLMNVCNTGVTEGDSNPLSAMSRFLEASTWNHERRATEEAEYRKITAQKQSEARLDEYQRDNLLQEIEEAIGRLNAENVLNKITVRGKGSDKILLDLQSGGRVEILFFTVAPPVELSRGSVRFAAHVYDTNGAGFNYLLVRKRLDDLYGQWQTCHARSSPFTNTRRSAEPFGFPPNSFAEEMPFSEGVMHIYTYEFGTGGTDPLLQLLADYMESRAKKH